MKKLRNTIKVTFLILCSFVAMVLCLKKKPSILMYHSFDVEGWRYGVNPILLEKQIAHLIKKYKLVSLKDIVSYAKRESVLPANAVAFTIDDGYEDTYSVFFPLAKKYQIPFTLFLTTDLSKKPNLGNLNRPTTEQLQEMYASGLMTLGLHGHSHIHFPEVFGKNLVKQEIEESESFLTTFTGIAPEFVAYPSGRYDKATLVYFREKGTYSAGVAIHSGFVTPGDDTFRLRRIEVSRNVDSLLLFKLRLTPALTVYNWLIKRLKI
jgi:peptidoglycan/xylan/chitin deacetylase (PgdA/CDA1 family)